MDGDDAPTRGVFVSTEPEQRAVVAQKAVLGIEVIEQLDHGGVWVGERLVKDAVFAFGPLPDRDNQIIAVFSDVAAEAPLFFVGPLVH